MMHSKLLSKHSSDDLLSLFKVVQEQGNLFQVAALKADVHPDKFDLSSKTCLVNQFLDSKLPEWKQSTVGNTTIYERSLVQTIAA